MVNDSEMEDFRNIVGGSGFSQDEFEIEEQRDPMIGNEIQPLTGSITIRRISTNKKKTYKAGHGSIWPASFHDDLTRGVFN